MNHKLKRGNSLVAVTKDRNAEKQAPFSGSDTGLLLQRTTTKIKRWKEVLSVCEGPKTRSVAYRWVLFWLPVLILKGIVWR